MARPSSLRGHCRLAMDAGWTWQASDWDTGQAREDDVFTAMAQRTGMPVDQIEAHADLCCRSLVLHPVAWHVAAQRRLPQALVTVNPDLFLKRIVPEYGLEEIFDVIVVSSAEGTADKVQLCQTALDRLGYHGHRSETLLIDNRADLVDAWAANGGAGYCYRDDTALASDWPDRGAPAQRLVRQRPGHRVPRRALAAAAPTPVIRLDHPAGQHRPIRLKPLAGHLQTKFVYLTRATS